MECSSDRKLGSSRNKVKQGGREVCASLQPTLLLLSSKSGEAGAMHTLSVRVHTALLFSCHVFNKLVVRGTLLGGPCDK